MPIIPELTSMRDEVISSKSSVDSTFSGLGWLSTDPANLRNENEKIYSDFKDRKIITPNPDSPPTNTVDSDFISKVNPIFKIFFINIFIFFNRD